MSETGPYKARTLDRFQALLEGESWREAASPRNHAGLLQTVHGPSGLTFVLLPEATVLLGSPDPADANPPQQAFIGAFLLARTPCTQEAWDRVGGSDKRRWNGFLLPIEGVRHEHAQLWCERTGLRLPTGAEWEYACRADGEAPSPLSGHAWHQPNSGGEIRPVATREPNAWGFHDMLGNVWEWCSDEWRDPYEEGLPEEEDRLRRRVFRGGAWFSPGSYCRAEYRWGGPIVMFRGLGFRPAADLPRP